jgi:hypothetical protein
MVSMPIAMFFGAKALEKKREQSDNQALAATR